MNILYVLQYFPVYGGGETVTVRLANEFVERGLGVYVAYTIDKSISPMPYKVDKRIKTKRFPNLARKESEGDVEALRKYIVENDIDIVINQWANKRLCFKATRGTKAKLIRCYHISTFYPMVPNGGIKKLFYDIAPHVWNWYQHQKQLKAHKDNIRYCDHYVFLHKYAMEELYAELKFDRSKVSYISNPATYEDYIELDKIPYKKHEVLYVGRLLEYNKRMTYFLKAWKLAAQRNGLGDWQLVIIGEGPDRGMVEDMIKRDNIPNVRLIGFTQPKPYYQEGALLLMTSYIEGFGMAILEGMQNGVVPIVTDSFSATKAIIGNGVDGLIVENNNIPLYTEAILSLINDKERREAMARHAIEKSKKFDVKAIADQWVGLFDRLHNNKAS